MDHQFNPDQPDDDTGNGESYQCVFCKRGFTNAQALGGHMNIHRRDRARMSSSTTSTSSGANKHHQNHTMLNVPSISSNQHREIRGYLRPNSSYSLGEDSKTSSRNYCHTYFPPTPPPPQQTSSNKHFYHQRPQHQQHYHEQQPLSLFQEDRSYTGLELRIGHPTMYIEEVKRQDDEEEEEEIDLELRLGHDN